MLLYVFALFIRKLSHLSVPFDTIDCLGKLKITLSLRYSELGRHPKLDSCYDCASKRENRLGRVHERRTLARPNRYRIAVIKDGTGCCWNMRLPPISAR